MPPNRSPENFYEVFEDISQFCDNSTLLSPELSLAREAFSAKVGRIKESDTDFTNRMNAFLLWYIFDWKVADSGRTPFELYCEKIDLEGAEIWLDAIKDFSEHIHSLFEFIKMTRKGETLLRNLRTKEKITVPDQSSLIGLPKGSYLETRIFRMAGSFCFSNYFIIHPLKVRKGIIKRIKAVRKAKKPIQPFLLELHSSYTKWKNYRNIDIRSIYHFDKSIPEAK